MHIFYSEDPIGFAGGINKYAYAGNDPIDYFDPFGTDKTNWSCVAKAALPIAIDELSLAADVFVPEGAIFTKLAAGSC